MSNHNTAGAEDQIFGGCFGTVLLFIGIVGVVVTGIKYLN
jgi:hypothetical protein